MKRFLFLMFAFCISCVHKKECEQAAACHLVPDAGLCLAAIPKYYYDKTERKCKTFIWGGCGGVVPFQSLEACKTCECNP